MKKLLFILIILPQAFLSQEMTNEKLETIYTAVGDSIQGNLGAWQFFIQEIPMMSITDVNHNRMRIISPITDSNSVNDELLKAALVANFNTV